MEKLLLFLMQGIPESSGYIAISLAFLRVPLRWKRIIAAGTVLAFVFFTVRSLNFTFGLHTAAGMFFTVVFIGKTTHITITRAFIAVIVSFATLALLELLIMESFFAVLKLDPQTFITEHSFLWMLLGLPQAFLLVFLALLIARFKKPQEDAWKT